MGAACRGEAPGPAVRDRRALHRTRAAPAGTRGLSESCASRRGVTGPASSSCPRAAETRPHHGEARAARRPGACGALGKRGAGPAPARVPRGAERRVRGRAGADPPGKHRACWAARALWGAGEPETCCLKAKARGGRWGLLLLTVPGFRRARSGRGPPCCQGPCAPTGPVLARRWGLRLAAPGERWGGAARRSHLGS